MKLHQFRKTFAVSPVELADDALVELSARASLERLVGDLESGDLGTQLVDSPPGHSLVMAAHLAFQGHRPLVLTPDIIWLTLLQGLAHHVRLHAEDLRDSLVEHTGKRTLAVRADDLWKGNWDNQWPKHFPSLVCQVAEHMKPDAYQAMQATFSTTGPLEKTVTDMAILNTMDSYFDYLVDTHCGIPRITLEGRVEDWSTLRRCFRSWEQFRLGDWVRALDPILEQFEKAAAGDVHPRFWRNLYKNGGEDMSGGEAILTGWIILFFPYIKQRFEVEVKWPNYFFENPPDFFAELPPGPLAPTDFFQDGLAHSQIPESISLVPFMWNHLNSHFRMSLISGLVGVEQDRGTLALRPRLGWAVRDEAANPAPPHAFDALVVDAYFREYCSFARVRRGRKHESSLG